MGTGEVQTSFSLKSLSTQQTPLAWDTKLRAGFGVAKAQICTSGKSLSLPMQKMKVRPQKYLLWYKVLSTVFQWFQQNNLQVQAPNTYSWFQYDRPCMVPKSAQMLGSKLYEMQPEVWFPESTMNKNRYILAFAMQVGWMRMAVMTSYS